MSRFWRVVSLILALHVFACSTAIAAQNDIIVLLASSDSMRRSDPESLTVQALKDYLQGISGDIRVAILTFSAHVSQIHPFTDAEPGAIAAMQERIQDYKPQGRYSNIGAGVERSIYELKEHGRPSAHKTIILLTDTHIHTGDRQRDIDFERWLREILTQQAAAAQIRIFGIALGEQADIQNLEIMASTTGGDYYRASNATEIAALLSRIHDKITDIAPPSELTHTTEPDVDPVPVTAPSDVTTTAQTDHRIDPWPSDGLANDAVTVTTIQESTDSPALVAKPRHSENRSHEYVSKTENTTIEDLGFRNIKLLIPTLVVFSVLLGLGFYLVLSGRKRRVTMPKGFSAPRRKKEPQQWKATSDLMEHKQAEEMHHQRGGKKAGIGSHVEYRPAPVSVGTGNDKTQSLIPSLENEGGTEELSGYSENENAVREATKNQAIPTRPPQQEPTSTTEECNNDKGDTEELPPLEFENSVVVPSGDAPPNSSKREQIAEPGSPPIYPEADDKTKLRPDD